MTKRKARPSRASREHQLEAQYRELKTQTDQVPVLNPDYAMHLKVFRCFHVLIVIGSLLSIVKILPTPEMHPQAVMGLFLVMSILTINFTEKK